MADQTNSDSDSAARAIQLGFKKSTEGLNDDEQKEYDQIQAQEAMKRRLQGLGNQ